MQDTITLHHLGPDDGNRLLRVAEGLFDNPIMPKQAQAFLDDPLHDMVLATEGDDVVGMASGQVMLHPDKPPAFFINEVGVRESHRLRGIGRAMCAHLIAVARARGCHGVWLATEVDNDAARALYQACDARETGGIVVYDWDGIMDEQRESSPT